MGSMLQFCCFRGNMVFIWIFAVAKQQQCYYSKEYGMHDTGGTQLKLTKQSRVFTESYRRQYRPEKLSC